jgi:membrane protein implicated in regulation of membrane protease activity
LKQTAVTGAMCKRRAIAAFRRSGACHPASNGSVYNLRRGAQPPEAETRGARMSWWGWIIAGAILLGAELTFVNAQFYLVFVGSAAILTGLATLAAPLAEWLQWALFGVLAVISMLTFRSRVYVRFRGDMPDVSTGPAGGVLTLTAGLAAGASCQTEHGGTYWTVRNDSDRAIPAGGRARIVSVHELTLLVRPDL